MPDSGLRIKKSRSMMVSLYSLSGVALLLVGLFLLALLYQIFTTLGQARWEFWWMSFRESLVTVAVAITLSFPFAAAISFLGIRWSTTRINPYFQGIKRIFGQAPFLLYGLVYLFFIQNGNWAMILTLACLCVTQVSRRWIRLSSRVKLVEIESMQALGLDVFQIIYKLYIKQFLIYYLGHLFAVYAMLLVIVTPLLCLDRFYQESQPFMSVQLFNGLWKPSPETGALALTLLIAHGLKVILDSRSTFAEVEYG